MLSMRRELKSLLHPYYFIHLLMALAFIFTKLFTPICHKMYKDDCEITMHEYDYFIFLACAITVKGKRQPDIGSYVSHGLMFAKVVNMFMFFRQNWIYALIYGLLWIVLICVLHKPTYQGPDKVVFFRDTTLEEEVLKKASSDDRVYWLIEFYAAWLPTCVNFQPIFAELSQSYGLNNLRFGKLDITRYPQVAKKFLIDDSTWTKHLPTVILFKGGKEVDRRPAIDIKGAVIQKFTYTWDNMVSAFNLNQLYQDCVNNPIVNKKQQQQQQKNQTDKKMD